MASETKTRSPSPAFPESCPLLSDAGNAAGWVACCSKYFYPLARRILGEDSLAEDALQDTWPKVLRAVPAFRGGPTACHWVRTIVANSARDIRRRRFRSREVALTEANGKDPSPDPETLARDRQVLRVLREMVASLPEPYRQVIELRFEQELSTSETARRLAISRSNVTTRLHRGIRMLKDRFKARTANCGQPRKML